MKFGHFFVDRPIFASVISIILMVIGITALFQLPIAQYPTIAPPTVRVTATYPGASAETIAETVAAPIEQQINGVEGMIYMSSQATGDGVLSITVTFAIGTDTDIAQVQVQNRVNAAEPRLPAEVRQLGVSVNKAASDFLLLVNLFSPDKSLDELYVSNYAYLNIRDVIQRIEGVGDIQLFGLRELSLRIWLDPAKLSAYGLAATDVTAALQEQNVQVSGGSLGAPPQPNAADFQVTVTTAGRFRTPDQFKDVIIKSEEGRLIRLKDVARIEFGARQYASNSYLDNQYSVGIAIQQRPGSNAVSAAAAVRAQMETLRAEFPPGLAYDIVYNPTQFVEASIEAVTATIWEAVALVVIVVLIFLQSWRAALIPIAAIPVSLIGTFAVMSAFGYSLNMLTLFGLILAIGIVVDDAIVVVENVERNLAEGKTPREAAHITMDEVGVAVIAIALVLSAVFIPTAFVPGISGLFYQQFALTIATATIISAINSLTLSPALAAILLKPHKHTEKPGLLQRGANLFNRNFDRLSHGYSRSVGFSVRHKALFLLVYVGLLGATWWISNRVPTGFIPETDQSYAIAVVQLPEGASLQRTDDVVHRATDILRGVPGISHVVGIAGFSGATFSAASNAATGFIIFDSFENRLKSGLTADVVVAEAQKRLFAIEEGFTIVIKPPSVQGLGRGGGFNMQVQDRTGAGLRPLEQAAQAVVAAAAQDPRLAGVYTTFNTRSPQLFVNVDREKAQILNVPIGNIFQALQSYIGSAYVNDFTAFGRSFQVNLQADAPYRIEPSDITSIKVRSSTGALVPLGSVVTLEGATGPYLVTRHNLYNSIGISGGAAPGVSSGDALIAMEEIAAKTLPPGVSFEWTELAFQERNAGSSTSIFALAILFVFLLLAAQYESWALPLSIILIVPLSILAALTGVILRGQDNNILTQVGFVVLIGLAAKNAILIVEFARQAEDEGRNPVDAAIEACRLRLRPILMTSLAFTLGVVPLAIATGAGSELRQALGTSVAFGMVGVTILGLVLTPVFYVTIRLLVLRFRPAPKLKPAAPVHDDD
ncbi:multidrug efflux RND transporter permease subunit [Terrihabitans rhizophilus]|jgi:HAE1 family hydrophobic/amphiphilic exporter-1|uniref:Efflux pump membrane transporter n=1 Tax=Terrihabitans rhizophilus TaxID=3092662 RepID=A0ABU4RQK8_9HYPH|nr:multidrug efflux RND transporter permease subunit [Terrihabitans sp. PJ23]MDX6805051.1 multidrug efflux RND transporter permease subunit [Terrihabitans sp. PJ23]